MLRSEDGAERFCQDFRTRKPGVLELLGVICPQSSFWMIVCRYGPCEETVDSDQKNSGHPHFMWGHPLSGPRRKASSGFVCLC